ncbi:DUF4835 domain-containing protein [Bacteroidales bacterium]|nr:DUF4835 domain-containing protein [Bacteroidales bacterium]
MCKIAIFFLSFLFCLDSSNAQELNAKVSINSDRVEGTNKDVFTTMQSALMEFINTRKWSSTSFSNTEKIECSFAILVTSKVEGKEDTYTADLTIQARRPVYNSAYSTNTINFRDTKFEFEYIQNMSIDYVENELRSNLEATISFYCYLILALDFDTYSMKGGSYFFREAQSITLKAQSNMGWKGWEAFESSNNRHAVINAYLDESFSPFRELSYTYHRKGLDEMAANPDRGRTTILQALPILSDMRNNRAASVLLQMFGDSKLDEIVLVASKASAQDKKETYELLRSVFVTMSDKLEPLKK